MNVKVVLFPDGEDPDSFAKTRSSDELAEYIKNNKQDFISFKAGVLLSDGNHDPILRAGLIKDIVHSVSLIPDQIMRSVYAQQLAQQFDISEAIVQSELLQLRKQSMSKQFQDPSFNEIELPKQAAPQALTAESSNLEADPSIYEAELVRLLLKYGTRALDFQLHGSEQIQTSVIELVIHELQNDQLSFTDPLHQEVYDIFAKGVTENQTLYAGSFFLRHENQQIVQLATNFEAQEQDLSHNWITKYKIQTKSEADDLYQTVLQTIYRFKLAHVENRISTLRKEIEHNELGTDDVLLALGEIVSLEKVKMLLSEQIGITVIR
jgi:DNA primase